MSVSNEDIFRLVDKDQVCIVEVSPATAQAVGDDNSTISVITTTIKEDEVNPTKYFLKGTAKSLLEVQENAIGVRWNGIYLMLIQNDEIWLTKYQVTYDYLVRKFKSMGFAKGLRNVDLLESLESTQVCQIEISSPTFGDLIKVADELPVKLFNDILPSGEYSCFIKGTVANLIKASKYHFDLKWGIVHRTFFRNHVLYILKSGEIPVERKEIKSYISWEA